MNEGEEMRGYFRKHPAVLFRRFAVPAVIEVIGVFILQLDIKFVSMIGVIVIVLATGKMLYEFIIWYYDIYIVTTKRVINIDQKGLFHREISESSIEKVQNVSQQTKGFVETIFGFGTVAIQTAANEIVFSSISHPAQVQKLIQDTYDRAVQGK